MSTVALAPSRSNHRMPPYDHRARVAGSLTPKLDAVSDEVRIWRMRHCRPSSVGLAPAPFAETLGRAGWSLAPTAERGTQLTQLTQCLFVQLVSDAPAPLRGQHGTRSGACAVVNSSAELACQSSRVDLCHVAPELRVIRQRQGLAQLPG